MIFLQRVDLSGFSNTRMESCRDFALMSSKSSVCFTFLGGFRSSRMSGGMAGISKVHVWLLGTWKVWSAVDVALHAGLRLTNRVPVGDGAELDDFSAFWKVTCDVRTGHQQRCM